MPQADLYPHICRARGQESGPGKTPPSGTLYRARGQESGPGNEIRLPSGTLYRARGQESGPGKEIRLPSGTLYRAHGANLKLDACPLAIIDP